MMLFLAIAGVVSGVTTVLFGFGGGFITVPLLVSVLTARHLPASMVMQMAVATSAAVMVFSSLTASLRQKQLLRQLAGVLKPLWLMIALGGIAGAVVAQFSSGQWIRAGFVVYLLLTLLDCLFRPGFLPTAPPGEAGIRPLKHSALAGLVIGLIAAFLGVGGSVMTVPLMRRRGATMVQAAALANPLTLPMALTATLTYAITSLWDSAPEVPGFVGYIDVQAAVILMAGSFAGMWLAGYAVSRVPDSLHARLYPWLLSLVLVAMILLPVGHSCAMTLLSRLANCSVSVPSH